MKSRFIVMLFGIFAMSVPNRGAAGTELFEYCFGDSDESCQIVIEGSLEPGLTQRLQAFVANGARGTEIYFNSPGGNLGEALRLGRYIRSIEFSTLIGGTDGLVRLPNGRFDFPPRQMRFQDGVCESACAYAFLGGAYRSLGFNGKLGFHRFRSQGQAIGDGAAQAISGELLSYLIEMGVDARLFILAADESADSMYHVTEEETREYDLVTTKAYSPFFLEPYKSGVIAASRKQATNDRLDLVIQVSAFCRRGQAFLLFFAPQHRLNDKLKAGLRFNSPDYYNVFPAENVSVRTTSEGAYLTLQLDQTASLALAATSGVDLSFLFERSSVGYYGVQLTLSDMDREMLAAAFRFRID